VPQVQYDDLPRLVIRPFVAIFRVGLGALLAGRAFNPVPDIEPASWARSNIRSLRVGFRSCSIVECPPGAFRSLWHVKVFRQVMLGVGVRRNDRADPLLGRAATLPKCEFSHRSGR
jgi:hypothetical protein